LRTHGGAVPRLSLPSEPPAFALRKDLHQAEKERIGRAAATLVRDGDSIALDASTTAWQIARNLKDRRELTVVTNGLFVALEFLDSPDVTVIMPGGSLRTASASLVGDEGAYILDGYHVQKAFFGAAGFTLEEGLTDTNSREVELKQRMVERSKKVIAVVDGSKWGQVAFAALASVDQLDHVIADDSAPIDMVASLKECGIQVTLV
jgi:DeoR/GlpR family transcriptional regulator of sugar metabolism